MNGLLSGKRIVVTGAARGLGYHFAKACAEQGAAVVIAARKIEPCTDGLTITPAETARLGAMSLTFAGDTVLTQSVRDRVGVRPWTVWPPL